MCVFCFSLSLYLSISHCLFLCIHLSISGSTRLPSLWKPVTLPVLLSLLLLADSPTSWWTSNAPQKRRRNDHEPVQNYNFEKWESERRGLLNARLSGDGFSKTAGRAEGAFLLSGQALGEMTSDPPPLSGETRRENQRSQNRHQVFQKWRRVARSNVGKKKVRCHFEPP